MLQDFSSVILGLALSTLGVSRIPAELNQNWTVTTNWEKSAEGNYQFKAENETLSAECAKNPSASIVFPNVVHGYQLISSGTQKIAVVGNPSFTPAFPFYQQPIIPCSAIPASTKLYWTAVSYSTFFGRISSAPYVSNSPALVTIMSDSSNSLAAGALLIISIFSFLIFRRRADHRLTNSLSLAAFLLAGYFINVNNSHFGIPYDMLTAHKVADFCLWLGAILFMRASVIDDWLSIRLFRALVVSCIIGLVIILSGSHGDDVQLGTMVPTPLMLASSLYILFKVNRAHFRNPNRGNSLTRTISVGCFALFGINDLLTVTGLVDSYMLLSFGSVIGIFGLSLAVNQKIEETYQERDSLLVTLEARVSEKTAHLEATLSDLRKSQAEQVESARLASLGTLSAGIAHEINNSINFVNGAVSPLEKTILGTLPLGSPEAEKAKRLFAAIRDGTKMTVDIVRSLRNYTGLNQAAEKEVSVKECVNTVLTILKNKIGRIEIKSEVDEDCNLMGSVVGINQIFMNLISNSLDAIDPHTGRISIVAQNEGEQIRLTIQDNGSGIPESIKHRIFDPFFTTKEVGKGTGLGLHIVKKEIDRQGGSIQVHSSPEFGTKFEIVLPKNQTRRRSAA